MGCVMEEALAQAPKKPAHQSVRKECGSALVSERRRETRLARKQRVINAVR